MALSAKPSETELRQFLAGFNAHDLDAIMAYFTEDAVFLTPSGPDAAGKRVAGIEAIRGYFGKLFQSVPDVQFSEDSHWISEDGTRGVSDWLITGTQPDGVAFAYRGTDHFQFHEGRIRVKDTYQKVVR